eukprot:7385788-Prymnesium_polylepis.1
MMPVWSALMTSARGTSWAKMKYASRSTIAQRSSRHAVGSLRVSACGRTHVHLCLRIKLRMYRTLQQKTPRRLWPSLRSELRPALTITPIAIGCSIGADMIVVRADTTDASAATIITTTLAGSASGRPRPSSAPSPTSERWATLRTIWR